MNGRRAGSCRMFWKIRCPLRLTVIMNTLIVELAGIAFELTTLETSTMHVLLTATVGFVLLFRVSEALSR